MTMVVGLDGCRHGWIAAVVEDGRLARFEFQQSAAAALQAYSVAAVLVFDTPIGLSKNGRRAADYEARAFLGTERGRSVFGAPPRAVLEAKTFEEARELAAQSRDDGRTLTQQTFRLLPKIRQLDEIVDSCAVREAHPEVSFAEMNGGSGLANKKTWDGLMQRRALLAAQGLAVPDTVGNVSEKASADDIVDAAACAWTAARIAAGTAQSLPDPPELIDGRAVAIWY